MKVEGSIFIDKEGIVFSKVKGDAQSTIRRFYNMLLEAKDCKDKLYYVYSDEWEEFWLKSQNPSDKYWQGAGQIVSQLLFSYNNFVFQPFPIGKSELFNEKSFPRIHGGLEYEGCPSSEYIYDKPSIDAWHNQWFIKNSDRIDWTNTNGIMPCYDRIITILRSELTKLKDNPDLICGLTHIETLYLASVDIELLNDVEVVSKFYSLIMDHKAEDGERIAYAKDIGAKICTANFYHEEPELKTLNKDKSQIVAIYSIKKEGKYQFLSIDKKHGRFEWCNENGNHICEIMFDSTIVENSTDASHSIEHIDDWKRIYHK